MKLPSCFVFFAWIPTSLVLAWGSVSFMLLNPDITSWPLGARLFLLVYTGLLAYIPKLAKNNIKSLVLFVLSGTASYAFFSFLLLCPLPTEWPDTTRWLSVFMFSWLASSFAPSADDAYDRLPCIINSLGIHIAAFFLPRIFS